MKTLSFVDAPVMPQPERLCGFSLAPSAQSPRLLTLTLAAETVSAFLEKMADWPVQALEYKSFLRFEAARLLDTLCEATLRPTLINVLLDRGLGGLLINPVGLNNVNQADEMVKVATAVAHLIGRSNFDAMSGQFYARFVVKNVDSSDSYLRQPHRVMELHNDGTYVDEPTDYVLMMKIDEQNMKGGNSLLLHLDDWTDCEAFFSHPLARRAMRWTAPPSKNTVRDIWHPIFDSDKQGRPTMRYIDQFVQPKDYDEGTWLYRLGESLENAPAKLSLPVPVGSLLLINNLFWLHGRDRFTAHPDLRRELMRQRGYFSYPQTGYQQGQ